MTASNTDEVRDYYDKVQSSYNKFWSNKHTLAMHYGFWDEGTRNRDAALLNQNRWMADALELKDGDVVLDAGCGVGGTAIWIAERYRVHVQGISLMENQIELAQKSNADRNVADRVTFSVQSYLETDFADGAFDKAYAMESMCHAESKAEFLAEMRRLLKPGGRLVVQDVFRAARDLSAREARYLGDWLKGWAVPNMLTVVDFKRSAEEVGYRILGDEDVTEKVMKSAATIHRIGIAFLPFDYLLSRGGRGGLVSKRTYRSTVTCIRQKALYSERVFTCRQMVLERL